MVRSADAICSSVICSNVDSVFAKREETLPSTSVTNIKSFLSRSAMWFALLARNSSKYFYCTTSIYTSSQNTPVWRVSRGETARWLLRSVSSRRQAHFAVRSETSPSHAKTCVKLRARLSTFAIFSNWRILNQTPIAATHYALIWKIALRRQLSSYVMFVTFLSECSENVAEIHFTDAWDRAPGDRVYWHWCVSGVYRRSRLARQSRELYKTWPPERRALYFSNRCGPMSICEHSWKNNLRRVQRRVEVVEHAFPIAQHARQTMHKFCIWF